MLTTARKIASHDADCQEAGVNSLPLSFEVLGGWSETSRRTIKGVACLGVERNAFSEGSSVVINRLTQFISIQLLRWNANMIITVSLN